MSKRRKEDVDSGSQEDVDRGKKRRGQRKVVWIRNSHKKGEKGATQYRRTTNLPPIKDTSTGLNGKRERPRQFLFFLRECECTDSYLMQ